MGAEVHRRSGETETRRHGAWDIRRNGADNFEVRISKFEMGIAMSDELVSISHMPFRLDAFRPGPRF